MISIHTPVRVEREMIFWIGDMRTFPRRAQEHPLGHVPLPERHRFAKEPDVQPFNLAEMRGSRQTVRAGPNNGDITRFHGLCTSRHLASTKRV